MAIPQVSWDIATMAGDYNYKAAAATIAKITSLATATNWPIGTVDADGLDKAVTTFAIWNNKGTTATPSTTVSDMQNCKITVVDANHGNTGAGNCTQLLGGGSGGTRWVSARCDSNGEYEAVNFGFVNVGNLAPAAIDDGAHAIRANSQTDNIISGAGNDGQFTTAGTAVNFALVTMKLNIPTTASAGPISGYIRASYSYV